MGVGSSLNVVVRDLANARVEVALLVTQGSLVGQAM